MFRSPSKWHGSDAGFNEGLKGLPENLQSVTFGTQFNQSLEGLKLPKLQSLTFVNNYRQTLEGHGVKSIQQNHDIWNAKENV